MIEKYNLIPNTQNGFRASKETSYCINELLSQITTAADTNSPLHIIYIDFAKAFDSVAYWAIEQTLTAMNFSTPFIDNINELFRDIHTQLKTAQGFTSPVTLNSGVRQGDVISPTLFILSLAPLIWKLQDLPLTALPNGTKEPVLTFADDTALLASNVKDLNSIYTHTCKYAEDFGIDINAKKSAYAWLNDDPASTPTYKGRMVEMLGDSKPYKYLGIYLSLDFNFSKHYQVVTNQCKNNNEYEAP
jgi:hypothetical protein